MTIGTLGHLSLVLSNIYAGPLAQRDAASTLVHFVRCQRARARSFQVLFLCTTGKLV